MNLRDLVTISTGNLWRMKLRAFLTVSGVVIAIAAFVSMLSFGAGMQENVARQFDELGLFSTMQVFSLSDDQVTDSITAGTLDQSAVETFSQLPGVNLAYPFDEFSVTVVVNDMTLNTSAQALPGAASRTKLFSQLVTGTTFESDSSHQAMITEDLLEELGIEEPDSLLGRQLVVSVHVASIDSGLAGVIRDVGDIVRQRAETFERDSLSSSSYWQQMAREELSGAMKRFLSGFMNNRAELTDTLTICGVLKGRSHGRSRISPVVIPRATAAVFNSTGFIGDPTVMFSALSSGTLFASTDPGSGRTYPRVTLDLDPQAAYQPIRDTVRAMGFRTFSYAEEFEEIRQFFLYFNMALGVIGFIAMITASLGIVNTMVMSIVERRREIGVLKSLGADELDIRWLFLVESGMIGTVGAVVGIVFGWLITRLASVIAKAIMANYGIDETELFSLPIWLILTALAFGLVVSLLAGFYPAARAARVEPVEALRND